MSEYLIPALALAAGLLLGALFFGALWWTIRKGLTSQRPALWFGASMVTRTGITLAGFYFAGGDQWQRWLACLIGFVLARMLVKRLTKPFDEQQTPPTRQAGHAA